MEVLIETEKNLFLLLLCCACKVPYSWVNVDTILMEVKNMLTPKEALQAVADAGTPIALIAKNINKDPSTLHKWLRGTSKYLSKEAEEDMIEEIRRIKQLWERIDI